MNLNYKLIFVGLVIMAALLQIASFFSRSNQKETKSSPSKNSVVSINQTKINVELADTQEEITTGLSNRESLSENSGMYFVFEKRDFYTFWMKGMRFPLDIIWIDQGKIVGIEKNAQPPSGDTTPTFYSPTRVTNVLEVNAGFSDKNNIKTGDKVELLK